MENEAIQSARNQNGQVVEKGSWSEAEKLLSRLKSSCAENSVRLETTQSCHGEFVSQSVESGVKNEDENIAQDYYESVIAASKQGDYVLLQILSETKVFRRNNLQKTLPTDGSHRKSALIHACDEGHETIVEFLVKNGADIGACDKDNKTALMYASERGWDRGVQMLIEFGADVNARDERNKTAFMYACEGGHVTVVNVLILLGANIDVFDRCGQTALMYACQGGHATIVEILVEFGADVNTRGALSRTEVACGKLYGTQRTALMYACMAGHIEIVEYILNHGGNVHEHDSFGMTSLMMSCERGDNDIVSDLMKHGACAEEQDKSGRTPLMHACINNRETTVELLLKKYAVYADARDAFGKTALMLSCQYGLCAIVDALIDSGLNLQYNERKRLKALSYMRFDNREKILFRQNNPGVDVDAFDKHRQTALMYVFHGASKESARIQTLHQRCPNVDSCFEKCMKRLLSVSANHDAVDVSGDTVFSIAMQGSDRLLKSLLDSGVLEKYGGLLKPQHRDAVPNATEWAAVPLSSLLISLDFGVFDWVWGHFKYFNQFAVEVMNHGVCPGKMRYYHHNLYPLSVAFMMNDERIVKTFLKRRYFYEEDYMFLRTHPSHTSCAIHQMLSQALPLKTWSFLAVSKAISLAGPPNLRRERVNALPIFEKLKRELTFCED